MTNIEIERVAVHALKPNKRNARTHSKKQVQEIATSISSFGFVVPVLVADDGEILAGHGRLAAAKLLGLDKIPVIKVQGLSEGKRRALMLADNRIAQSAGWDRELLSIELPELKELLVADGLDLSVTGFTTPEIDQLVVDFEDDPSDPQDSVDPEWMRAQPVTQTGDLWHLGAHRLLCGDARNPEHLARLMGDDRAGMVFTDPPYNVRVRDIVGRGQVKHAEFAMASGELSSSEFVTFLKSSLACAGAVSREGAVHYVCMDWRHVAELVEAGRSVYGAMLNLVTLGEIQCRAGKLLPIAA